MCFLLACVRNTFYELARCSWHCARLWVAFVAFVAASSAFATVAHSADDVAAIVASALVVASVGAAFVHCGSRRTALAVLVGAAALGYGTVGQQFIERMRRRSALE